MKIIVQLITLCMDTIWMAKCRPRKSQSACSDLTARLPCHTIISNYWLRLSRIWRILQIKESVIHRGQMPRWITLFEICWILHILRKPNSINYCFIIYSKYFPTLKGVLPFCYLFFHSPKITQSHPQVFFDNGSIICSWLHFWHHFDIIGSIICHWLHFWRH